MRKITYLVAPLMVLPFLVGCNKTTTYKVAVAEASDKCLVFKSEDGKKDLKDVKAEKGKEFKFRVEAVSPDGGPARRIVKDYIITSVGGSVLYDGILIHWDEENEGDHTKATVTIDAAKVTGDIVVGGLSGIEGYYMWQTPYILGAEITASGSALDENYPGYAKTDGDLVLKLTTAEGDPVGVNGGLYAINNSPYTLYEELPDDLKTKLKWSSSDPNVPDNDTLTVTGIEDSFSFVARAGNDHWLDFFDWSDIKEISEMGIAEALFVAGDTKHITVNDHEHEVEIVGFNHDYTEEGEGTDRAKAGITFKFNTILSDKNGNAIPTTWGKSHQDFKAASLNEYLNKDVFGMLPNELKADGMIKTVYKPVGVYTSSTGWKAEEYPTQLFPLSVVETGYEATYDVKDEGTKYDKVSLYNLRDANGALHNYWLRSPNTETDFWGDTYNYSYVIQNSQGSASLGRLAATSSRYVIPCFCI